MTVLKTSDRRPMVALSESFKSFTIESRGGAPVAVMQLRTPKERLDFGAPGKTRIEKDVVYNLKTLEGVVSREEEQGLNTGLLGLALSSLRTATPAP